MTCAYIKINLKLVLSVTYDCQRSLRLLSFMAVGADGSIAPVGDTRREDRGVLIRFESHNKTVDAEKRSMSTSWFALITLAA